ncbi:MAG: hypothetical protein PHF88_02215, partial [Candidatus Pacebacteria bacterium]|nr:hypothetical protein [Candidatus Paceibacterota bacterium]
LISGIVQNSKPFISPALKFGKSIGKTAALGARQGMTAADRRYNELKDSRGTDEIPGTTGLNPKPYNIIPTTEEKILGGITKGSAWVKRASKNPYALEMEKYSKKEKLGENITADDLKFAFGGMTTYNDTAKMELFARTTAKEINKFLSSAKDLDAQKKILSMVNKLGNEDTKEKAMRASLMGDGKDNERIQTVDMKYDIEKVISEVSGKAVLDINAKAFDDIKALAALAKSWKPNDLKIYANENREIIDKMNGKIDIVIDAASKNNPALYNNMTSPNSMFKIPKTNSIPRSEEKPKSKPSDSNNYDIYKED